MKTHIHRRTFLQASGISLALPMLESMSPAFGLEVAKSPKRMVLICTTLGLHGPALFPKKTGADYEATEYLSLLKEHRKQFTFFSGLSHPDQGGEHQCEMTWLSAARNPHLDGFRNSISVDQFAANQLGYVTRFPSVRLSRHGSKSQSYTNSGVMVPAESKPSRMFAKMFLRGSREQIEKEKRKLSEGRSVLDELMDQAKSLGRKATAADRKRMDEYFESVRKAEKELTEAGKWLDRPKPKTDHVQPKDIHDRTDLIGRTRLLLNLIPMIVQTDSSRVITMVIQDHQVIPKVDGVSVEHHNLSHHGRVPSRIKQLVKIEKAILGCFGDLLGSLKNTKEASGNLLDNTMVLFGSNLGNANAHDSRNLPIFLAGGDFKHGKHVAFDKNNNKPLCNLFTCMLDGMGIAVDSFASSTGKLTWQN